ncbi:hypothetical protein NKH77_18700 [Streptomyces sp. M19]
MTGNRGTADTPLDLTYTTGRAAPDSDGSTATVRLTAPRAEPAPVAAVATGRYLDSSGARVGSSTEIQVAGTALPVRIVATADALPTTGEGEAANRNEDGSGNGSGDGDDATGGALLVDFRAVNQALAARSTASLPPTEWWLRPAPGRTAQVAAALRDRTDTTPADVLVRDEIAAGLHDDPLGAGPRSGLAAAAVVAAALAAVGFAVSMAGSLRERAAEFAVLRALGAPGGSSPVPSPPNSRC